MRDRKFYFHHHSSTPPRFPLFWINAFYLSLFNGFFFFFGLWNHIFQFYKLDIFFVYLVFVCPDLKGKIDIDKNSVRRNSQTSFKIYYRVGLFTCIRFFNGCNNLLSVYATSGRWILLEIRFLDFEISLRAPCRSTTLCL